MFSSSPRFAVFALRNVEQGCAAARVSTCSRFPSLLSSSSSSPPGGHVPPPTPPEYLNPAGHEPWHGKVATPGSGGRAFKWPLYNERIHPPQMVESDAELNSAYICHMRANIKYSPWKMWYIAHMVRGLTVDEAIKQLQFVNLKGALSVREVLEEAVEIALAEHDVEFRTNLWVAESFCHKGSSVKGYRRHSRSVVMGRVHYHYANYFVRLEEGTPPEHYTEYRKEKTPEEWLEHYVQNHREKSIPLM